MSTITLAPTGVLSPEEAEVEESVHEKQKNLKITFNRKYVWRNVFLFAYLHAAAVYGLWLLLTQAQWWTCITAYLLYVANGLGITAGAHRLWAHRSFKAKWPLRIILAIFQTLAFQNDIFEWARDHRVHHKFSETDADPHNAKRGFFFAHIGWLLEKKHPLVMEKGKTLDYSDLMADPIVRFQRKFYLPLVVLVCFLVPTLGPWYFWNESLLVSFFTCALFRYCFALNVTWLVNSAAHMWGNKPYDRNINPAENIGVALGALGEGWHNYHHTFPWDYKTSELPFYVNFTTMFIDFFGLFGLAYDRKTVTDNMIKDRALRTGDGSHKLYTKEN